jgi:hypothetical protein
VILRWEAAYAKSYAVLASDNGTVFTPVLYETNGNGGTDTVTCSTNARYVRMTGLTRATLYGYSLYEFEVYGTPPASVATSAPPLSYALFQNYPNPFNPTTEIQWSINNRQSTIVKVFDMLGREVATLLNEVKEPGTYAVQFDGRGLASGTYFYRLQAGNFTATKRMVLMK